MLHAISLGAGVQSSTMALMFAVGEMSPMPECAVFADTQAEPRAVYEWLAWLSTQLPFPVVTVTAGDLAKTSTTVRTSKTGTKYIKPMIPAFVDRNGRHGMSQRHCTLDYKITVILRELRKRREGRCVRQYIGISYDEVHRMKASKHPWLLNAYPLVDRRMTRQHCLAWMQSHGYPEPPRSACVFCPYHNDTEWLRLAPAEFADAVAYEKRLQAAYDQTPLDGVPYLHASRVPLDQVAFGTTKGTADLFGNECEGMCGV